MCSASDEHLRVYGVYSFTFVGVVAFICRHFGANAPRDVVSTLHREIVPCHQSYSFPPSSQQLFEAIQQVVKERCMTWLRVSERLRAIVKAVLSMTPFTRPSATLPPWGGGGDGPVRAPSGQGCCL